MNVTILPAALLATGLLFLACHKEPEKPEITIHELGDGEIHGNNHIAHAGGDLHMDIEVVAEGKIDKIQVLIHPEIEYGHKADIHYTWEVDTTYIKFSGLKNTVFHEHIEIDTTAEAGEYHFDFIVTDMEGNQSSAEAELEIFE